MQSKTQSVLFWSGIFLLSLFAIYQAYRATTWGVGLSPDSLSYLKGARSIVENKNLQGLGTHWPPLYFILIALCDLITGNTLVAARYLQVFIFFLNLLLFSLIIWKSSHGAFVTTLIGTLLFVTAQPFLHMHTIVLSEPLFFLLTLLGFYCLSMYLDHENHFHLLFFSAFFTSLAFLTRYVGITLIISGTLLILLYGSGNIRKRLKAGSIFAFFSTLPALFWVSRNLFMKNEVTSRHFAVHPVSMENIRIGLSLLLEWLHLPAGHPFMLLVSIVLLAALFLISTKKTKSSQQSKVIELCFIFIIVYLAFLLVSISFFDAQTDLNERILSPVFLFLVLGVVLLHERTSHLNWYKKVRYITVFAFLIFAYTQYTVEAGYVSYTMRSGLGFAGKMWVLSDTLKIAEQIPADSVIYTNGPEPLYIYANRPAKMIPRHTDPGTKSPNKNFLNEVNLMVSELSKTKGVIVYFNNVTWRWYLPTPGQLKQLYPFRVVYKGKDGLILQCTR